MSDIQTETINKVSIDYDLEPPVMWRVIYIDDNKTTFNFVVETLISIFDYDVATAGRKTMEVHEKGEAVVAVLDFEVADQKVHEVESLARFNGYPFEAKLEQDL